MTRPTDAPPSTGTIALLIALLALAILACALSLIAGDPTVPTT